MTTPFQILPGKDRFSTLVELLTAHLKSGVPLADLPGKRWNEETLTALFEELEPVLQSDSLDVAHRKTLKLALYRDAKYAFCGRRRLKSLAVSNALRSAYNVARNHTDKGGATA